MWKEVSVGAQDDKGSKDGIGVLKQETSVLWISGKISWEGLNLGS